jgi:hypothetical protein
VVAPKPAKPSPAPDAAVVRAGRRRWRRRLVLGSVALIVMALTAVVAGPPVVQAARYRPRGPLLPASEQDLRRLGAPTAGDLAGDQAYLAAVQRSWAEKFGTGRYRPHGNGFQEVRGEPRVLWAGTTPAGPAAVVGQLIRYQHRNKTEFRQDQVLLGFVDGEAGRPGVLDAGTRHVYWSRTGGFREEMPRTWGFLVGADRSALLVVDPGVPVGYALGVHRPADGLQYTPLEFRDGVAVVAVPARPAIVVVRLPYGGQQDLIPLAHRG